MTRELWNFKFYRFIDENVLRVFLFQPLRYPLWIPAAVEYGSNPGNTLLNAIIHCVGKPLGKKSMIAVVDGMNAAIEAQ